MIPPNHDKRRSPIPRWRPFRISAQLGELDASSIPQESRHIHFGNVARAKDLWNTQPGIYSAAGLVAAGSLLRNEPSVIEAAKYLLQPSVPAIQDLKRLSERTLDRTHLAPPSMHAVRQRTRVAPRDAISWADLALSYASIGKRREAERAITASLRFAPDNRFVLRAAARLFVHLERGDRALDVLEKSAATRVDPWLLAAHTSISSLTMRAPKLWKYAKGILAAEQWSPYDYAELQSAIATQELYEGNVNRAKKLYKRSLISPNENSVAQVEWAAEHAHIPNTILDSQYNLTRAYEARARRAYFSSKWEECFSELQNWMQDQPFSRHPALMLSALTLSVEGNPSKAQKIAQDGLRISPGDLGLINNLSIALAQQGKIGQAVHLLNSHVDSAVDTENLIFFLATAGLIKFRAGDPDAGRKLYRQSIDLAEKSGDRDAAKYAELHWMFEEINRSPNESEEHLKRAQSIKFASTSSSAKAMLARMEKFAFSYRPIQMDIDSATVSSNYSRGAIEKPLVVGDIDTNIRALV